MDDFEDNRNLNIFKKIFKHIGLYSIVLVLVFILINMFFSLLGLRVRAWINYTVICASMLGMLIGIVKWFISQEPGVKRLIGLISSVIIYLGILFWQIPGLILLCIVMLFQTEHVVERDGQKYVAYVESNLLHTTVYYYDYMGPIFVGTEAKFEESYKGSFDPIEREKEEKKEEKQNNYNNVKQETIYNDINEDIENTVTETQILPEIIDEADILYTKDINEMTKIRVIYGGSVLGQKMGIRIQKTNDGGKTWQDKIKSQDKFITVNSEAEFVFINENVRIY